MNSCTHGSASHWSVGQRELPDPSLYGPLSAMPDHADSGVEEQDRLEATPPSSPKADSPRPKLLAPHPKAKAVSASYPLPPPRS